jgi:hypothetical protein
MTWFTLFTNILALVGGFVLGLLAQWRQQEMKGRLYLVPHFHFSAKRIDLLLAVGVVLALAGTTAYGVYNSQEDRACNLVLREGLEAQIYSTRKSREATRDLVTTLLVDGPATPEKEKEAVAAYEERMREIDKYLAEHPIPEPEPGCGGD